MHDHRGLVIFDLDGTLFCADDATVPAVQQCLKEFGLPVPTEQEILSRIGPSLDKFLDWVRSLCPPDIAPAVADAVVQKEHALLSRTGYLYPGTLEALTLLRASVCQMAVCTYAGQNYADEVMRSHGLAGFFDGVRCWRSAEDTKYHMLRELLQQLDCRPAVVVGDRAVDIEAAHANGLRAIGVLYGYGSSEELATADAIASAPSELPALVHRLLPTRPGEDPGV
jgi:phosphoglycolate phosphatase